MAALNPLKSAQILPMFVIIDQYSKSDLDYADFSLISGADRLTLKYLKVECRFYVIDKILRPFQKIVQLWVIWAD